MLFIFLSLIAGLSSNFFLKSSNQIKLISDKGINISVFLMLLLMGLSISGNKEIIQSFGRIGFLSLIYCLVGMLGSIAFTIPLSVRYRKNKNQIKLQDSEKTNFMIVVVLREALPAIIFLSTGIIAGLSLPIKTETIDIIIDYNLYLLLFFSGVSVGNLNFFTAIKQNTSTFLLLPVLSLAGSVLATFLLNFLIQTNLPKSGAGIGGGMGYYSIAAVLNRNLSGDYYGVLALTTNLMREIFTILLCPLLVKFFGPLAPISTGGATSMDTTLPFIRKYSGKDFFIIAFSSGVILTFLVPVFISFILKL